MFYFKYIFILMAIFINGHCFSDDYLVIHGLNARMEKMADLLSEIESHNHNIFKLVLAGHKPDEFERFKKVEIKDWEDDFLKAYSQLGEKKHLVAYSLGALVSIWSMVKNSQIQFETITFFAPAVSSPWYTRVIKMAPWFGIEKIPSLAPKGEQVHTHLPVNAYIQIFKMQDALKKIDNSSSQRLNKMDTLIMMDSRDGMVSYSGVEDWLKRNHLTNWKLKEIKGTRGVHHMVIQKAFLEKESWNEVQKNLIR